jgi:hypothetical protein
MSLPTLLMREGLDNISLLGSNVVSNSNFIFISANGYNIYNGLILVYYKNITIDKSENILSNMHSIIESPEKLNSNFGLTSSANEQYLAVGAISYDVYKGAVYIYKYIYNKWLYMQKLVNENGLHVSLFGDNIKININNQLIISDYSKLVYIYILDDNNDKFIYTLDDTNDKFIYKTNLNSDVINNINHLTITTDKYNNIIISNPSLNLYAVNLHDNSTLFFDIKNNNDCFYGSYLFLYENTLFISCSLYYPFTNIPDQIYSKIYVYDIIYNLLNNIISLQHIQTIYSPLIDNYFGTYIESNNKILLVSGLNNIYYYEKVNEWNYVNKYTIPESYINNDYKFNLLDDTFIIGNYGYNYLSGALFMAKYPNLNKKNDGLSINSINSSNIMLAKISSMILLILGGVLLTILITLFCYLFTSLFTHRTDDKKDKKDEEEYSPYKVHSYVGYVEMDDPLYYKPSNINNNQFHFPIIQPIQYSSFYNYQPYNNYQSSSNLSPIEKGIPIDEYSKKDVGVEKISKETVVSYKNSTYDSIIKTYEDKIKPQLLKIKNN